MKRDRFYQQSYDEKLYEELLDRACTNNIEVMDANIEEILGMIAWQDRIEERAESILPFPRENKQLTEEEISLAMKNNWITDNTLN